MPGQNFPKGVGLEFFHRAQFGMADILRRAQGVAVASFGLGPSECPYEIVASGMNWRLRDYGGHDGSRFVLIVAAPIKGHTCAFRGIVSRDFTAS